ncbi:MAG: hypothetical protein RBS43_07535 [Candidatus Cloacimonas sp.]|jgi:YD repeat-containing protein|nr:hypothetical protein [Candidatus Cloacimonas sp.]
MKLKKTALLSLILIVLAIIGYIGYQKLFAQRYNYYRNVTVNGRYEITGINPLKDNVGKVSTCYHFIYDKKHRTIEVESLLNGKLSNKSFWGFGVAKVVIEYSDEFIRYIYKDIYSNSTSSNKKIFSVRIKLNKDKNPIGLFNYDKSNRLTEDKDRVVQFLWTPDKEGRRVTSLRLKADGERITDNSGLYEIRWKYDNNGNDIENAHYGKDGQLLADSTGVYLIKKLYDKAGNQIEWSFWGPDGQLTENVDGIAITKVKYSADGLLLESALYGTDNQRKAKTDSKVAIIRYEYDKFGNRTKIKYLGIDEQPVLDSDAECAVLRMAYDTNGNIIQRELFGIDGTTRCATWKSVSITRYKYDDHRNTLEASLFDVKDKPTSDNHRVSNSIYRYKYNGIGQLVETTFFDTDGKATMFYDLDYMYSKEKLAYDDSNRIIERSFYDSEDNLTNGCLEEIAIIQYRYRESGYPGEEDEEQVRTLDSNKEVVFDHWTD